MKLYITILLIWFFYTTTYEAQWQYVDLSSSRNEQIVSLLSDSSYIYAGIHTTENKGLIYRSEDNGITWIKLGEGIIGYSVHAFYKTENKLYIGTGAVFTQKIDYYKGAIYLSSDNGLNWSPIEFPEALKYNLVNSLIVDNNNIYAGMARSGIYISFDNGNNWSKNSFTSQGIYSLVKNSTSIIAGGIEGIFISNDNGLTWIKNFDKSIISLAIGNDNIYAGGSAGVFVSNDKGTTWTQICNFASLSLLLYDNNIFIGGKDGIYLSKDNGLNWLKLLSSTYVRPFMTVKDSIFFTCTSDLRLYYRKVSDIITSVKETSAYLPSFCMIEQNYPNPFNPETTISYKVQAASQVRLKVYDVLGRKIATLVNEFKQPGNYTVKFNVETLYVKSLPSGVYFYTLHAGDFVQTKKMVLVK